MCRHGGVVLQVPLEIYVVRDTGEHELAELVMETMF